MQLLQKTSRQTMHKKNQRALEILLTDDGGGCSFVGSIRIFQANVRTHPWLVARANVEREVVVIMQAGNQGGTWRF